MLDADERNERQLDNFEAAESERLEREETTAICGENDDAHAAEELDAMRERAEKAETWGKNLEGINKNLSDTLMKAEKYAAGLQSIFDSMQEQSIKAIDRWRIAHPVVNEFVYPEPGELLKWLMGQVDSYKLHWEGHAETLRSIMKMDDISVIRQWISDSFSGYVESTEQTLFGLQKERDALQAQIIKSEGELGAVLPEDVGPVEYIKVLQARGEMLQKSLDAYSERTRVLNGERVDCVIGRRKTLKKFAYIRNKNRELQARVRETEECLKSIAYAKTKEWDDPSDSNFKAWAQNIAKYTFLKLGKKQQASAPGEGKP